MKQYKRGYTAGVFDYFHKGHLNLLKNAKNYCDYLIVGVNDDDLVVQYKNKIPLQTIEDRMEIVSSIKYVDLVVKVDTLDKIDAFRKFNFDVVFIGDDWRGTERWKDTENKLKELGVSVVYLPYTKGISSSLIREKLNEK